MMLEKLNLHNFRCFEDLEIEFDPKLTVIVGANGAGKSTILDAVAVAMSSYLKGFNGYKLTPIRAGDARNVLFRKGDTVDVQPQYPVRIGAVGSILGNRLAWTRSRDNAKSTGLAYLGSAIVITHGTLAEAKIISGSDDMIPLVAYYGTSRLWKESEPKPQPKVSFIRQDGYKECLNSHLDDRMLSEWFEKMTYKDLQRKVSSPTFQAVRRAMETVFQRITNCDSVTVQTNLDSHKIEILYRDHAGKGQCQFMNQLSDGYRCTLYLIADIAYRMAILNPQLLGDVCKETAGIVLIDEVDLHLHPAWQQRILGDLCEIFPKVQFIVTTHAPAVINTVERQHIRILRDLKIELPPMETYGRDANGVLKVVMSAQERPQFVLDAFENFYQALDNEEYQRAEKILNCLEEQIGEDPDTVAMRVQLDMEQL